MAAEVRRYHVAFIIAVFAAGCSPIVLHKAHVQPGSRIGATLGTRHALCDTACTAGVMPAIALYAEHGWLNVNDSRWNVLLTAVVPGFVFAPAAKFDLYVQAPADPRATAFGAGISASVLDIMPYIEFGRTTSYGSWYVVQGVVRAAERPEPDVLFNGMRGGLFTDFVGATYWSPQLGYESPNGSVTLYLGGAFGRSAIIDDTDPDHPRTAGHRPVRVLVAGVAFKRGPPFFTLPDFGRSPRRPGY